MGNASQLGNEEQNHLTMENPQHQAVVSSVMNKWQGPNFAERSNEGQAVQAAINKCAPLDAAAKAVAPKGTPFGVEGKNLSDRAYDKYGGANKMMSKNEGPAKNPAARGSLSDRKY